MQFFPIFFLYLKGKFFFPLRFSILQLLNVLKQLINTLLHSLVYGAKEKEPQLENKGTHHCTLVKVYNSTSLDHERHLCFP